MKAIECRATSAEQTPSSAPGAQLPVDPQSDAAAYARLTTRAAVDGVACGAFVAVDFGKKLLGDTVNLDDAMAILRKSVDAVNAGDLAQVEGMLLSQASALNAIFASLARRAAQSLDTNMVGADFNLRLALKAQSQSRATLETLANIKNPKAVAFVRQANIANGPQQVNNNGNTLAQATPHAEQTHSAPNELLENLHGERLDFGTQGTAGRIDPQLATVGAVDRAD